MSIKKHVIIFCFIVWGNSPLFPMNKHDLCETIKKKKEKSRKSNDLEQLFVAADTILGQFDKLDTINNNLRKGLDSVVPPVPFLSGCIDGREPDYDWMLFERENKRPICKKERSCLFPHCVHEWASYDKKWQGKFLHEIVPKLAFIDPNNGITPLNSPFKVKKKDRKLYGLCKTYESKWKEIQQEVIKGLSHRFKMHLQIKPEYIPVFVKRFLVLLEEDYRMQYIDSFKVAYTIMPGENYYFFDKEVPEDAFSTVVVYPPLLTFDQLHLLEDMLLAIEQEFEDVLDAWWLKIPPRLNKHIKGFIYLGGGDADDKLQYKKAVEKKRLLRNIIFTPGYIFFKGCKPPFL